MTYRGHVRNGQIMLDEAALLPEGAEVHVDVIARGDGELVRERRSRRIRLDPAVAREIASSPEFLPDEV